VWSAFRLARRVQERQAGLVLVTRGPSRADPLATAKLDMDIEAALALLFPETMAAASSQPAHRA
jgi:hypothetical protein